MKKLLFLSIMAILFASCEKDPDMNKLDSNFTVYTNYDSEAGFKDYNTFYLPDSILLVGQGTKSVYWKDENAQKLVQSVAKEMTDRGYVRTDQRDGASLGVQLSYVERTTQVIGLSGGMYGGWWDAGFWGPWWGGWYYPYPISYSYDTGTFIMDLVDLSKVPADSSKKEDLSVIWHAYASGLLYGSSKVNIQLTQDAITQAFEQSPYISKTK